MTITPFEIYASILNPSTSPVKIKPIPKQIIANLELDNTCAGSLSAIQNHIKQLRAQDFDYQLTLPDNRILLIKDWRNKTDFTAVHPLEADIQALRYLAAILLIQQNNLEINLLPQIKAAFAAYQRLKLASPRNSIENASWLIDQFVQLLENSKLRGKTKEQLNIAKDLGILLEEHPDICTISENSNDQFTIELASHLKISPEFYDDEMRTSLPWFASTLIFANIKKSPNWLELFFMHYGDAIKEKGWPAPPSARWLPLPANIQNITTYTADKTHPNHGYTSEFIRFGTTSAYDINNVTEQKRLSTKQLQEITKQCLQNKLINFKKLYADVVEKRVLEQTEFEFNYLHLLSPITITKSFYPAIKDNNAAFVAIAKNSIAEVRNNYPKIQFNHTNAAINTWASYSHEFNEDNIVRQHKIKITHDLLDYIFIFAKNHLLIKTSYIKDEIEIKNLVKKITHAEILPTAQTQLRKEITLRLQAAFYLNCLLKKLSPYNKLHVYQRNLMMAALEFHLMGSQAYTIAGCKSARDRTAIFSAAVRAMQENPATMYDWALLESAIIRTLEQGHHFRAMSYHTAIVKLSDVHKEYAKKFSQLAKSQPLHQFTKAFKKPYHPHEEKVTGDLPNDENNLQLVEIKMIDAMTFPPEKKEELIHANSSLFLKRSHSAEYLTKNEAKPTLTTILKYH